MDDLSHLLPGGPVSAGVPTAQNSADSRPHENHAMTAPGGDPADGIAEHTVPAPDVEAITADGRHLVRSDES